jgi:DNA-binding MurR/RpiR family transcriptional regulator
VSKGSKTPLSGKLLVNKPTNGRVSLDARIRASFNTLSPKHQSVADYLVRSDRAPLLTARQIAQELHVSEATVVRLASKLGYSGFPALQLELKHQLLSKVEWRALGNTKEIVPNDPLAVLQEVLRNDQESLRDSLATVAADAFRKAVSAIVKANTIYVLGFRTSAAHAMYMAMRLRPMYNKTYLISYHHGDLPDQLFASKPGDLLIAINYYRYRLDTVRVLRLVRKRGVRTIVITDDPLSPPAQAGDIILVAPSGATKLLHSPVAPLSVLNALAAAAAVVDKERAGKSLARAYKMINSYDKDHSSLRAPMNRQRQR